MNKSVFVIKKWSVRALVAVGAMLGLSSCGGVFNSPKVYGPPPSSPDTPEVVEDVYGPPVKGVDSVANNIEVEQKRKTDSVL